MKNYFLIPLTALILALLLSGCGTIHGAGSDIKSAGEHIQGAADTAG